MSALIKSGYDKLLAAFALGLMAVSGGWAWLHQGAIDLIRNHAVTTELTSAAYTPPVLPRTETQPTAWARPAAQSHGRGWLHEVFTPPVIYYNPLARSFAVTPPLNPTEGDTPFGLELLQVMLEPYRLQWANRLDSLERHLARTTPRIGPTTTDPTTTDPTTKEPT